jgi:hypothetical protein
LLFGTSNEGDRARPGDHGSRTKLDPDQLPAPDQSIDAASVNIAKLPLRCWDVLQQHVIIGNIGFWLGHCPP